MLPKIFLQTIFIFFILFGFSREILAATYTVCTSGCDKTTVALVFSSYDLSPGDIIEIQADSVGGTKTISAIGAWGTNDAGDATSQVTLRGRVGDTIIVDTAGATSYGIFSNTVSYITIQNIEFRNATVANIYINSVSGNISILDCSSSGTGRAIRTQSGNSNITVTNFVSDHNTLSVSSNGIMDFTSGSNITLSGITLSQDITDFAVAGISFVNVSNITLSDVEVTGSPKSGLFISGVSSGTLNLSDIYSGVSRGGVENGNVGISIYITGVAVPATFSNINSSYGDSYGMYLTGTSTLQINNSIFNNNAAAGLHFSGFVGNIIADNITSNGNAIEGIHAYDLSGTTTISNVTVNNNTGAGLRVTSTSIDYLYLNNIDTYGNTTDGIVISGNNTLDRLTITDVVSNYNTTGSGLSVFDINNGTVLLSNIEANHNGYLGIGLDTVSNFIYRNNVTNYNHDDGFNSAYGSIGVVTLSVGNYNGAFGCGGGCGDGFSSHDNDHVDYYYNIGAFNTNTGFAHVETTTGDFYNNISWANGSFDDFSAQRCQTYLTSTADPAWTIRNHISGLGETYNDYCEYRRAINSTNDSDYNLYYPISENAMIHKFAPLVAYSWDTYHITEGYEPHTQEPANPLFVDAVNGNFALQYISPAIDKGVDVGLTTDYLGNPIYGNPDIGPYEYQPPYDIGDDLVYNTGSIRIYSDGKYRYKEAVSGSQISIFSVTPVGGFASGTYNEYMDITIDSWDTSGDQNKEWTASSSVATSTVYTIGNLIPSTGYTFKLDGTSSSTAITGDTCIGGVCTSDSSGSVTFTYIGGYSTHTFTLEKVVAVVPTTTPTPTVNYSGGTSVQIRVQDLIKAGNTAEAQRLQNKYPDVFKNISTKTYNKNLRLGSTGDDVKRLQVLLNSLGYTISKKGLGSPGNETNFFGQLTKQAVIRFQKDNNINPAVGYFGPLTRAMILSK